MYLLQYLGPHSWLFNKETFLFQGPPGPRGDDGTPGKPGQPVSSGLFAILGFCQLCILLHFGVILGRAWASWIHWLRW